MKIKRGRNCAVKIPGHIQKQNTTKQQQQNPKQTPKTHTHTNFSTLKMQKVWVKLPNCECWQKWLKSLQLCLKYTFECPSS